MEAYAKRLLKKGNSKFAGSFGKNKCAHCGANWHVIDACPILYDPNYMFGGEKYGCIPTYKEWTRSQVWCSLCFKLGHVSENCSKNIVNKNPEHEFVTNQRENDYDTDLFKKDDNLDVSTSTVGNFGVEWENFVQSQNVLCKDCLRQITFCDACTKKHFDSKRKMNENLAEDLFEDLLNSAIDDMLDNDMVRSYIRAQFNLKISKWWLSSYPYFVHIRVKDMADIGDVERVSVGTCELVTELLESLPLVDSPPEPQRTPPSSMFDDFLDSMIGKDNISCDIPLLTNLYFLKHICGGTTFDDNWHTKLSQHFHEIARCNHLFISIFNEKLRALHRRVLKFLTPPRSRFK